MSDPVVVVGAGFGGLAAAVRLRAMGYPVRVVEATDQPGGRASVFKRDGFSFDAGPTVITAPHLVDDLFRLLGRDPKDYYELLPVDPFYRVKFPDGSHFDYVGEEDRILSQIEGFDKRDVDGYRRLANMSREIFQVGYEQLVAEPFDRFGDMMRIVPQMLKLRSFQSVYSLVSSYIHDERLRQVFTFQPLLVGGNPYDVTSIYLLIHWLERKWGVWFPRGGTTALVHALVQLLEECGVEFQYNSPVERIDIENGRAKAVITADGQRIPCQFVVCNSDPATTYSKLVDPAFRRKHTDASIARGRPSMSLFVGYFGTNRTFPELAHHSILLGPRYKGLLNDIFHKKVLADDFSLYLHAPTRTDPGLAPPGHEGFYVLSPVPNNRSGLDWSTLAEPYFDKILDALDAGPVPGVKQSIVTKFSVDPRYFTEKMRAMDGAAFGLEPTLLQSAWFRFHNRSEDVEGLYFVGASTHPGAGVPGVLNSARVLERVVPRPTEILPVPEKLQRMAAG